MFYYCTSITSIDLSNCNVDILYSQNAVGLCDGCTNLVTLNIPNWIISTDSLVSLSSTIGYAKKRKSF